MKVLIAIDSFKDCLTSMEAGLAIQEGIRQEIPTSEIRIMSVADGGEGTANALLEAVGGNEIFINIRDPLNRPIRSSFVILADGSTAIIEMAKASGLELLSSEERNPWISSSYGTGELIREALNHGCKKIIVALGGSATNDAGAGMAKALGIKFLDKDGNPIKEGGGALDDLYTIDVSGAHKRLSEVQVLAACDVSNPLTGINGASYVYGPQKGADESMVKKLDANLVNFARVVSEKLKVQINQVEGAGAAGGTAAALIAFANAQLRPGFDIVSEIIRLEENIQWADIVITGEGRIDSQTQYGKTPMGVCLKAVKHKKPVIAVAGTLGEGYTDLYKKGFNSIFSILDKPMTLDEALKQGHDLLTLWARSFIRLYLLNN